MYDAEDMRQWYADNPVDLEWLEKPSRHQFRWRLHNNRWVTANRQFSTPEAVQSVFSAHGPRDVYIGTSAWLTPLDLPKRSDEEAPNPVLLDHLVVFDIDERPFCYRRLERARQATHRLLSWLDEHEDLTLLCISYSGGKGFHLLLKENDRTLFSIPSPSEREEAVRASRKALLERVLAAGFPVDATVTGDTRRIIRLPGSLHGTTGWCCTRLSREMLASPLKAWKAQLPKHRNAKRMPYWPYGVRDLLKAPVSTVKKCLPTKKSKRATNTPFKQPQTTTFQVSTQVVGTKGRSAFLAWLPVGWKEGQLASIAQQIDELGWGPVHRFNSSGKTLLVAPRALPKEQLQKVMRNMGWFSLANEIKRLGHAWIDASPAKIEGEELEDELQYLGIWQAAGLGRESVPWSATHVEFLKRLGVEQPTNDGEIAGREEPALRMASKV